MRKMFTTLGLAVLTVGAGSIGFSAYAADASSSFVTVNEAGAVSESPAAPAAPETREDFSLPDDKLDPGQMKFRGDSLVTITGNGEEAPTENGEIPMPTVIRGGVIGDPYMTAQTPAPAEEAGTETTGDTASQESDPASADEQIGMAADAPEDVMNVELPQTPTISLSTLPPKTDMPSPVLRGTFYTNP